MIASKYSSGVTPEQQQVKGFTKRHRSQARLLVRRFLRHFLRGAFKGVCIQAGMGALTVLLRNSLRKSLPHIWQAIWSKGCARLALFCGLFPSVYYLVVDIMTLARTKRDDWTYRLSAFLAGLSIAVLEKSQRYNITLYAMSRGMRASVLTLVDNGHLPYLPYADVAVFVVCSSLLVMCTALYPSYLSPAYYRSVVKWSRDYTEGNLTTLFRNPASHFLTCQEGGLHTDTCMRHHLTEFLHSLPQFAKMHLPICLAPILLFKRKQAKERPLHVSSSFMKSLATSTLFLGVMVTISKLTICLLRNWVRVPPPLPAFIPAVAGALCGLAVLIEKQSRRSELSQFVIPHTLNILITYGTMSGLGSILAVPHASTLFFSLAMASLMDAFEVHTDALTPLSQGVLKLFVGKPTSQPPSGMDKEKR